jgi:hypothetical protein
MIEPSEFSCLVVLLFALTPAFHGQELSSQPKEDTKVCVAAVSNRSKDSLMVDRLTDRLTRSIVQNKLYAVKIDSDTTSDRDLHPTIQNSTDMKTLQCDFLLLTQVSEVRTNPTATDAPSISIGKKVPSIDASDPMGGSTGPVYRDNVEIRFAIFRVGKIKPDLDTTLLGQSSANASDSLMSTMDREANRVGHELKKK